MDENEKKLKSTKEEIQRLEKEEMEERYMLRDELNYNINNTLSQEGNNRLGILMQKGKERETMFTTPLTSPIEYPEDPEDLEIMPYSGPRRYTEPPIQATSTLHHPESIMYTQTPRQETLHILQPPQQYRLNAATSSTSQITPQPISEIQHIINKVAAGTQTQPLGIANMDEIKTLIKIS